MTYHPWDSCRWKSAYTYSIQSLRRDLHPNHARRATKTRKSILDMPQEALSRIFEALKTDNASLLACCLTHRSWVRAAQKLLFRSAIIRLGQDSAKTNRTWYSTPRIARSVSELLAVWFPMPPSPGDTQEDSDWKMVSRFTRVTTLTVLLMSWSCPSYLPHDLIYRPFVHVRTLHVELSDFRDVSAFMHFLTIFPALDCLRVAGISWDEKLPSVPPAYLASPLRLSSLTLAFRPESMEPQDEENITLATQWLPMVEVQKLTLECFPSSSGSTVATILGLVGHKIPELELSQVEEWEEPRVIVRGWLLDSDMDQGDSQFAQPPTDCLIVHRYAL